MLWDFYIKKSTNILQTQAKPGAACGFSHQFYNISGNIIGDISDN